jgi:hypothetical protein
MCPVKDDLSTYPVFWGHPDLDPQKPMILVELDRLVDRLVALAPERRKAIRDAARRLESAAVGDRAATGQQGNRDKGEESEMRVLMILMDLGISFSMREAASKAHEEMTRRWEKAGRVRPAPLSRKRINEIIWRLREKYPADEPS